MQLITIHKLMIAMSIVGTVVFSGWSFLQMNWQDNPTYGLIGAGGVVVAGVLAAYLRHFIRKHRQQEPG